MNERTGTGLKPHPLAELLPQLEGEEFEALVADIKANGLLEPITTYQGMVLEGRNRDRACGVAGIKPETQKFEGPGSPAAFVLAKNVHRRHLNESQRALFAAKLREQYEEEARANMSRGGQGQANLPDLNTRDRAAEAVNVSSRLVGSAEKVLKDGVRELAEAVKQGEVAVSAAAEVATLSPEEQAEVVDQGPKAVRARSAALRRAKKGKQTQGTSPEPQSDGADPATDPPTATAEDQLPDEEWLKLFTIPAAVNGSGAVTALPDKEWLKLFTIRSGLSRKSRARFDREALYWRGLDKLGTDFFRRLNTTAPVRCGLIGRT